MDHQHDDHWIDSRIACVVDALQAPAFGVQTAPFVSALLQLGAAAACGAETVATVPGQHRSSLRHDACLFLASFSKAFRSCLFVLNVVFLLLTLLIISEVTPSQVKKEKNNKELML